ncbi:MAG: hydrogenase maturation nickel metallochaperone HypA [Gallionella sp.]
MSIAESVLQIIEDQARAEIIETAGQGWCMDCARNVALPALYEPCPNCGGVQIEVTGGEEMRVKKLEVE